MSADQPKAFVQLAGIPIVTHALRGALASPDIAHVVVVGPAAGMPLLADAVAAAPVPQGCGLTLVPGGPQRPDSVAAGLAALPADVGIVLVHDAARALTPPEVFARVVHAVRQGHPAVVPALPVTDTVKQVEADAAGVEHVVTTLQRGALRAVQTPQGFLRETLDHAHAVGMPGAAATATDDAQLVEATGGRVTVVLGHPRALKITTRADLALAQTWLTGIPEPAPAAPADASAGPALVVLSGLPGVGKTTVARALARRLDATHLRVDTIEQSLVRGGTPIAQLGPHGYAACYEVAADQLTLGRPVVADAVNGLPVIREAWAETARRVGARLVPVVLVCSDDVEHRRRVEQRAADISGHRLPDWQQARQAPWSPWPAALTVDVGASTAEAAVDQIADLAR